MSGEEYRSQSFTLCSLLHSHVTPSFLGPNILLGTLFSTPSAYVPPPSLRSCEMFHNNLRFYDEELLAPRPTSKLEDYTLSAVRECLFDIFAASLLIWRRFLHLQPEDSPALIIVFCSIVMDKQRCTVFVSGANSSPSSSTCSRIES
jgi:hypothetical protein